MHGEVYKLRWGVYRRGEYMVYLLNGMLLKEFGDIGTDEDT